MEERYTVIEGLYDPNLALHLIEQETAGSLVLNSARLGNDGRLAVLGGSNRGGKSTYLRAVGLGQTGLPVPATAASLSPVDGLYTQSASEESRTVGYGRFDAEAHLLTTIFDRAGLQSLVLLNEPLNATNPEEAMQLARGVVEGLQYPGARTILVTHAHALAREAPAFTDTFPDAPVISLVPAHRSPAGGMGPCSARSR